MNTALKRLEGQYRSRRCGEIHLGTKDGGGAYALDRSQLDTHAQVIGPTGGGKTRLLQAIAESLIEAEDSSVIVLDPHDGPRPHGGLYHAVKSYCYENGHEDRLVTIDPAHVFDFGRTAGFNPLLHGRSPRLQAGFAVEHLRAVIGDSTAFAAAPMLARWAFNVHLGLSTSGLAMADALAVLDLDDGLYRRIFGEILSEKYRDVASDWRWLAKHEDVRTILDDKLGSTTNRLRGYVASDALRPMLSTRRHTLDIDAVIRNRMVMLVNLATRDVLDEVQQRMLGMQLVHAICQAAKNRKDADRTPCYLIVDEFSKFLSPIVLEILDGTRKFGLHLILAHQCMSQLQDAALQDWRYYHAVMTNARLKIVFGGLPETDADTFARHFWGPRLDPFRIKQELYRKVQYSYVKWIELLTKTQGFGVSNAVSDGEGAAHLEARGWQRGKSHGEGSAGATAQGFMNGDSIGYNFDGLDDFAPTFSVGYSSALTGQSMAASSEIDIESFAESGTTADVMSTFRGRSRALNGTCGQSRARVPFVFPTPPEEELSSREFMALEEQLYQHAARLRLTPDRNVVIQPPNEDPVALRVRFVGDPEQTIDDVMVLDHELLAQASWAGEVSLIHEETRERDAAFRRLLKPPRPVRKRITKPQPEPKWIPYTPSTAEGR